MTEIRGEVKNENDLRWDLWSPAPAPLARGIGPGLHDAGAAEQRQTSAALRHQTTVMEFARAKREVSMLGRDYEPRKLVVADRVRGILEGHSHSHYSRNTGKGKEKSNSQSVVATSESQNAEAAKSKEEEDEDEDEDEI